MDLWQDTLIKNVGKQCCR